MRGPRRLAALHHSVYLPKTCLAARVFVNDGIHRVRFANTCMHSQHMSLVTTHCEPPARGRVSLALVVVRVAWSSSRLVVVVVQTFEAVQVDTRHLDPRRVDELGRGVAHLS